MQLDKLRAAFLYANTTSTWVSGRLFYVRDSTNGDIGFLQVTPQGGNWSGNSMEVGIYGHRFAWYKISENQYASIFPHVQSTWVAGNWYKERQISNSPT